MKAWGMVMVVLAFSVTSGPLRAGQLGRRGPKKNAAAMRKTAPPLAGLPSKPGPHIARIKALGDNQWLKLPPTAADPNCPSWRGKSYGRSWSPKAAYAPDLGGAFITGEAAHVGHDAKTGYYGDDVWFYDLYANRWIAIYPGTKYTTFAKQFESGELKIDDAGVVRDKTGMAIPAGTMSGHAGFGLDYDTKTRKFFWGGGTCGWLTGELVKTYKKVRAAQGKKGGLPPGLWEYDVATGKFKFESFGVKGIPYKTRSMGFLQYVSSNGMILDCSLGPWDWWLDIKRGSLVKKKSRGDGPPRAPVYGSCYDPKRDRVYVYGTSSYNPPKNPTAENHFFYYDVKRSLWVKPGAKNAPVFDISWGRWTMDYDTVNDRLVTMWINNRRPLEKRFIYVYNPETNAFEKPIPLPRNVMAYGKAGGYVHTFFCPELNTYFVHTAPGDNRPGNTWVWRYKRAPGKK